MEHTEHRNNTTRTIPFSEKSIAVAESTLEDASSGFPMVQGQGILYSINNSVVWVTKSYSWRHLHAPEKIICRTFMAGGASPFPTFSATNITEWGSLLSYLLSFVPSTWMFNVIKLDGLLPSIPF